MLPVSRTASSTLSRLGSYLRLAAQTPVVMCSVAAALAQPLLETLRIVKAVEPVERDADLRNKTILVTGATAGVGLATCKRLAARGARVLVCGRNAERTRKAVEAAGVANFRPASETQYLYTRFKASKSASNKLKVKEIKKEKEVILSLSIYITHSLL